MGPLSIGVGCQCPTVVASANMGRDKQGGGGQGVKRGQNSPRARGLSHVAMQGECSLLGGHAPPLVGHGSKAKGHEDTSAF